MSTTSTTTNGFRTCSPSVLPGRHDSAKILPGWVVSTDWPVADVRRLVFPAVLFRISWLHQVATHCRLAFGPRVVSCWCQRMPSFPSSQVPNFLFTDLPSDSTSRLAMSWFPRVTRFPCIYKQMLRRFPTFQVATTCFSCSPPDLNFLDPYFIFMYMHNNHCHRATAHLQLNILLLLSSSSSSLSPVCRVFILIFLRQTLSLGK